MLELKPERLDFDDFQDQTISVCGKVFRADMSGALYWPSENALIVADLHLEKGSACARRGQLVPPYDTRETLRRLAAVIDRYDAGTVIALGDSLHDVDASNRMGLEEMEILQIMQEDRDWIWVTGNHDPKIGERLGGSVTGDIEVEGIVLRHEQRHASRAAGVRHFHGRSQHPR
jgi:DNA ligase-associated metallophosphoesterase